MNYSVKVLFKYPLELTIREGMFHLSKDTVEDTFFMSKKIITIKIKL